MEVCFFFFLLLFRWFVRLLSVMRRATSRRDVNERTANMGCFLFLPYMHPHPLVRTMSSTPLRAANNCILRKSKQATQPAGKSIFPSVHRDLRNTATSFVFRLSISCKGCSPRSQFFALHTAKNRFMGGAHVNIQKYAVTGIRSGCSERRGIEIRNLMF